MGEITSKKPWPQDLSGIVESLKRKLGEIEALIVFGSWSRSGGGDWSDIDILVISDNASKLNILDRFGLPSEIGLKRVNLFIYTYKEIESMTHKANPLALSALVEGIPVIASERVRRLSEKMKRMYIRDRRMWIKVGNM